MKNMENESLAVADIGQVLNDFSDNTYSYHAVW